MKTEQIIKTLQDWKRIWKLTGEVGLTLDAAIEELQFSENKLRLVVARQNELIKRVKEERDQAREEAETVRALYKDATGVTGTFPWEEGSK